MGWPEPPPISNLSPDLLWNIFQMNADMNDDEDIQFDRSHDKVDSPSDRCQRALTCTRLSSQVCSLWRSILLDSPSIWGRLIDVGLLCLKWRNYWAEEIVRRSQDSPLHIKGPIAKEKAEFILDLLDKSWDRVCVLDVKVGNLGLTMREDLERIQNIIFRPTKGLQFFKLDIVSSQAHIDHYLRELRGAAAAEDRRIFSDEAPSLKAYCHSPRLNSRLPGSHLLSNIHTFSLLGQSIELSASHLVRALKQIPRLETLRIRIYRFLFDTEWDVVSAKRMELHFLDKLEFCHDDINALTKLMDFFEPSPGCAIHVQTTFPSLEFHCNAMQILLSRYATSYFEHNPPSALGFVFRRDLLILKDISEARSPDSRFYLCMKNTGRFRIVQALPTWYKMVNAFFYPLTAHMDNQYFRAVRCLDVSMGEQNIPSRASPPYIEIFRILSQLDSVETLAVYNPDLPTLNSYYAQLTGSGSPFPRLRTLQFRTQRDRYAAYDDYSDEIGPIFNPPHDPFQLREFLGWHKQLGIPIEVFEYTCPAHTDLRFLERDMKFVGLKIKCTSRVQEQRLLNGEPCTIN
ncbi:hypothetical protein CPC08DRAFT_714512 [Agrocybe pediades]|nr:hypothetical protein CPC08DRAFT_714512 [Agrocybe pediades]